jgi:hypothetical protein
MKTISLPLVAITLGFLSMLSIEASAEETWIDLNLDASEVRSAPPTAPFATGAISHGLAAVNVTAENKLEVAKDAEGFPGKALRFIKGSSEPRTPRAIFVNSPGLMTSGKVRFTWESAVHSFTASPKFPGFEALMNFGLLDATGTPFFSWYYLITGDSTGGIFGCGNQKLGKWAINQKQQFEIIIDLDSHKAEIKIDGTEVGSPVDIPAANGLRLVQFSDGTGLAFYGSTYTAMMAHFKMTKL